MFLFLDPIMCNDDKLVLSTSFLEIVAFQYNGGYFKAGSLWGSIDGS